MFSDDLSLPLIHIALDSCTLRYIRTARAKSPVSTLVWRAESRRPTYDNPGVIACSIDGGVERTTSHVVPIDIEWVFGKNFFHVRSLVIEGNVDMQFIREIPYFLIGAGGRDYFQSLEFGQLTYYTVSTL